VFDGVLLDIDGVLTVSWAPLPGAVATIEWLQRQGIEFRLLTNTSSRTRREIASLLRQAGMDIEEQHVLTAVTSAARYLTENYEGTGCFVLNEGDIGEDLEGIRRTGPDDAGVVLLGGAGPSIGFGELNTVFTMAIAGAPLVALHRNLRFQTADGPALDMGAFVLGLEAATECSVTVVGKPSPSFYAAALRELGMEAERVIMVGDDIVADVIGAQHAGISGALVRTGKFRHSDLEGNNSEPDHVLADIGELPDLLSR
jgi:HAD superfamily hydrolase (TIGR01458 family)